jgi:hypothetical protein
MFLDKCDSFIDELFFDTVRFVLELVEAALGVFKWQEGSTWVRVVGNVKKENSRRKGERV